jgi:hypothetical protein
MHRTIKQKYLEENLGALNIELSPTELVRIRKLVDAASVFGERYPPMWAMALFADTPPLEP